MPEAIDPAPFSRILTLRALVAEKSFAVTASTDEAADVACLFGIDAVDALRVAGAIEPGAGGFRLRGAAEARVTQRCVVTGEPVTTDVIAPFERCLVVGEAPVEAEMVEIDPDADDFDYLDRPEVDVGAVAVEELALSLDPYPRASGADAALAALRADDPGAHPFAALARRRAGS